MFRNWLTYLKEGNTSISLEINEVDKTISYGILEIKRNKGELTISNSERVSEIESIKGHIKGNIPVLLIINTSSILTKITFDVQDGVPEALVDGEFPNLDLNSFYYQISQQSERPIISIAKKEYIDGILERFNRQKISIANFYLGIGSLESILSYTHAQKIFAFNTRIAVKNNLISESSVGSIQYEDYTINGLKINSTNLLGFSHAVAYLSQNLGLTNFSEANRTLNQDLHNRRIFNFGVKYGLLFFIGMLLFNFLMFDHYQRKVITLGSLAASNTTQRDNLIKLESTVNQKKKRFEALTSFSNSRATYYFDELAKNIPATVLLDGIQYQPLTKKVHDSKPISLVENTILVSGVSKDDTQFSNWLENLERLDWIETVEIIDYDYMTKESSNFSVKIDLHAN